MLQPAVLSLALLTLLSNGVFCNCAAAAGDAGVAPAGHHEHLAHDGGDTPPADCGATADDCCDDPVAAIGVAIKPAGDGGSSAPPPARLPDVVVDVTSRPLSALSRAGPLRVASSPVIRFELQTE